MFDQGQSASCLSIYPIFLPDLRPEYSNGSPGFPSKLYKCVYFPRFFPVCSLADTKETTLERADFTLQLLMFVTAEKERRMFTIFFLSSFCQLLSPRIQARTG